MFDILETLFPIVQDYFYHSEFHIWSNHKIVKMKVNLIHCIENWMIPCLRATLLLSPGIKNIIDDYCWKYIMLSPDIKKIIADYCW